MALAADIIAGPPAIVATVALDADVVDAMAEAEVEYPAASTKGEAEME